MFDCKCKTSKIIGENITTNIQQHKQNRKASSKNINNRHTGYPAQDPTANKYLSGSGWEIFYLCMLCCVMSNSKMCMCVMCLDVFCRV